MAPANEEVDLYKAYIMLLRVVAGLFRTPQGFSNPGWAEAIFQLLRQRCLFGSHSPQPDPC